MKLSNAPSLHGQVIRRSRVHQAVQTTLLAAAATLVHVPLAVAADYLVNINTPNGADGTTPSNAGNGFDNDGKGGDAPGVNDAGDWVAAGPDALSGASGPAVRVTANGGNGGNGGDAVEGLPGFYQNGGAAASGGNGGAMDLRLSGPLSAANNNPTVLTTTQGGNGGKGGSPGNYGATGKHGDGGAGGKIRLELTGSVVNGGPYDGSSLAPAAVEILNLGGDGGGDDNGSSRTSSAYAVGTPGGKGGRGGSMDGNGGIVFVTESEDGRVASSISSQGAGIVAISRGGNGGQGAQAIGAGAGAKGGDGGSGGDGADVTIFTSTTSITARGVVGHSTAGPSSYDADHPTQQGASSFVSGAIVAQSLGGSGGAGGGASGGDAGSGGVAGWAGTVNVATSGNLTSTGYGAAGIVAQSIAGSGGNGATAGAVFGAKAGNGAKGGTANLVHVRADSPTTGVAVISTHGDDADGIIAQSIGGGGGNGGSLSVANVGSAAVAIGGRGENGGDGNQVIVEVGSLDTDTGAVNAGAVISTNGLRSAGVLAQSIGGGGGNGGSAYATSVGAASLSIGGRGGIGGSSGSPTDNYEWAKVTNRGFIQTAGEHSAGVLAQSIGGGGGSGGAAHSLTTGVQVTVAAAVGGNGGAGGVAGGVLVENQGSIVTMSGDSYGILAQSIGGGGGQGGASFAETVNVFNAPDVPSVNLTTSIGGNGGTGGDAGFVTVNNSGMVSTQQAGSMGIYAQSVGGGGGVGGQSSSVEIATQSSTVNVSATVGGRGGAGGRGGNVRVANDNGLVMTFGENAIAIWGQSIGGGGGYGGAAKSDTASFLSENKSLTIGLDIGGAGGSGNVGGAVVVSNNGGSVLTLGDGARGVSAQSVGGGGGLGGASSAGSSGGKVTINVAVGGKGGNGNDGGYVEVDNSGSVVTYGGKADGIFAHSVGGAGGIGGNAATGGGTDPELRLTDFIQKGLGIGAKPTTIADNIYGFAKDELLGDKAIAKLRSAGSDYLGLNEGEAPPTEDTSWTWSLDIGAGVGGKGGSGGNGNTVTVSNTGEVATIGANSAGIFAQSVGGGGGVGGTSTTVNNNQGLSQKNVPISGTVSVGGGGGSGGHGGDVIVTNAGTITTEGDASAGIFAQSVGAGGGDGGGTVSNWTQVHLSEVSIGGDGGATGDGGNITVTANAPGSSITTIGDASAGVVAQSVGGGGGSLTFMEAAAPAHGGTMSSQISWLPQKGNLTLLPFRFAGSNGSANCGSTNVKAAGCGDGKDVQVSVSNVSTTGLNSHGVVAQSAGGGGGILLGVVMQNGDLFGAAGSTASVGNGGSVNVNVGNNGTVSTTNHGAYGILAQSIGGGALLAGDFSDIGNPIGYFQIRNSKLNGDGGQVNVTVDAGSTVSTSGAYAHGIFAQSVGGGGGLVSTQDGLLMGTAGGTGKSGQVNVTVNGKVQAAGYDSSAVFINVDGQTGSTNPALLTVGSSGYLSSAGNNGTVVFNARGNTSNKVVNNGYIEGNGGKAIVSYGPSLDVDNYGEIKGAVGLGGGTLQILRESGRWTPGAENQAAMFVNNSEIDLNAVHKLNGDLVNNNAIISSMDFSTGTGGVAEVSGSATMNAESRFVIDPVNSLTRQTVRVLTASNLLLNATPTASGRNNQFLYSVTSDANSIFITPQANVGAAAQQHGATAASLNLAQHLDAGFNEKVSGEMAQHYAAVAALPNGAALVGKLGALTNEGTQSVAMSHLARSHSFVERMNSCPQFADNGTELGERPCTWVRVIGSEAKRGASSAGAGYKNQDSTVQVGGQIRLQDDWFLGGSISSDSVRADDSAGNTHVKGRGFTLGAVLKRQFGNWLVSGAVDAGVTAYDSERRIRLGTVDRTAEASFDGQHLGIHARVARQIPFSTWYLKPYMDVHATRMQTDGYSERNAGALNLNVSKAKDTMLAASPMLELGHRMDFGNGLKLHSYVSAGMMVYNDNSWNSSAQLVGIAADAGSFQSVSSAPNSRAKLNVGANLFTRNKLDVKLEYSGEFASRYRSHTGSLKLSYLY